MSVRRADDHLRYPGSDSTTQREQTLRPGIVGQR